MRSLLISVLWIGLATGWASAQTAPMGALINQALDQPVTLQLNTTLPKAMDAIADTTGVRVEAEPAVWELLPWGQETNVSANVQNIPLRTALEVICRKLALVPVLTDQSVELRPLPALQRLGRRSTLDELQALDLLARTPFKPAEGDAKVKGLLATIDKQLTDSTFAIENRAGGEVNDRTVNVPRNATLLAALEAVAGQTEATWYPWGKTIVVLPKDDQVRNQLAKRITRNYSGVPIGQVLTELSELSGVQFTVEPGALQRISPEFRTIKLLLDNASIEQALEHISGFTGLGFVVNDRGVYLWAASTGSAPTAPGRDPVVAMIEIAPGIQAMVPQSQVPPEVRDQLRTLTRLKLENLAKKPTTTPSTQPVP